MVRVMSEDKRKPRPGYTKRTAQTDLFLNLPIKKRSKPAKKALTVFDWSCQKGISWFKTEIFLIVSPQLAIFIA